MTRIANDDDEVYPTSGRQRRGGRRAAGARPALSGHVPVRFAEDTIRQVRALAERDGVTVSAWIRQVVGREVERRLPSRSVGLVVEVDWALGAVPPPIRTESVGDISVSR